MKSKWLVAFVMIASVASGLGIWYYVALRAYEDLNLRFAHLRSGTKASHPHLKELNGGRREVSIRVLTNYTSHYKKQGIEMMQIQQLLSEGKGMSFWLPDARREAAKACQLYLDSEDATLSIVEEAVAATNSLVDSTTRVLASSSQQRTKAVAILESRSESKDFKYGAEVVSNVSALIAKQQVIIDESRKISPLAAKSESLRVGVLNWLGQIVTDESGELENRRKALLQADAFLAVHRAKVSRVISSQSNVISAMNSVARELSPVVNAANQKVKPLRDLLAKLDEPIGGEMVSGLTSMFRGAAGRKSFTPIGIIKDVDPMTGATIEAIEGICNGVAQAQNEIEHILEITRPLLEASERFEQSGSRESMLGVVEAAPKVASYYESKRGVFDSITSRLHRASVAIDRLDESASRVRIPGARNIIDQVTRLARDIVSVSYRPFNSWQETVTTTTESLNQISLAEKEYVDVLAKLKADQSGPAGTVSSLSQ